MCIPRHCDIHAQFGFWFGCEVSCLCYCIAPGVFHYRADHRRFSFAVHQEDQRTIETEGYQELVPPDPGRQGFVQAWLYCNMYIYITTKHVNIYVILFNHEFL